MTELPVSEETSPKAEVNEPTINPELEPFFDITVIDDSPIEYYKAGIPGYESIFPRDLFYSAFLTNNLPLLKTSLNNFVRFQATETNPTTGARLGRGPHEIHPENGVVAPIRLEGREQWSTEYNSCDSTALFLIGLEQLRELNTTDYELFVEKHKDKIKSAADHVLSMVNENDLFFDEPPVLRDAKGAIIKNHFALHVTYWKDSILPHGDKVKREPTYPVSYALAHFIAARGLLSAESILSDKQYGETADRMYRAGISTFINEEGFTVYQDAEESLVQPSSDELHSLAFIPSSCADQLPLNAIKERAKQLETDYGYACTPDEISQKLKDKYHGYKVWVFEQSIIHAAATRFGLTHEANVAARIKQTIGDGQELFGIEIDKNGNQIAVPEGNKQQLWSIGAKMYFDRVFGTDNNNPPSNPNNWFTLSHVPAAYRMRQEAAEIGQMAVLY